MSSKFGGFLKSLGKKMSNREDDVAGLTENEKQQLERIVRERKFQLVAEKKLRDLERKFAPKTKKPMNVTFAEIKKFRKKNLARRMENMDRLERRKLEYKKRVADNKMRRGKTSKITERERLVRNLKRW